MKKFLCAILMASIGLFLVACGDSINHKHPEEVAKGFTKAMMVGSNNDSDVEKMLKQYYLNPTERDKEKLKEVLTNNKRVSAERGGVEKVEIESISRPNEEQLAFYMKVTFKDGSQKSNFRVRLEPADDDKWYVVMRY